MDRLGTRSGLPASLPACLPYPCQYFRLWSTVNYAILSAFSAMPITITVIRLRPRQSRAEQDRHPHVVFVGHSRPSSSLSASSATFGAASECDDSVHNPSRITMFNLSHLPVTELNWTELDWIELQPDMALHSNSFHNHWHVDLSSKLPKLPQSNM